MIRRHVLKFQYDRLTVDISYTVGHVYISLCSSITIRHLMLSNIYCTFGFEYCINVFLFYKSDHHCHSIRLWYGPWNQIETCSYIVYECIAAIFPFHSSNGFYVIKTLQRDKRASFDWCSHSHSRGINLYRYIARRALYESLIATMRPTKVESWWWDLLSIMCFSDLLYSFTWCNLIGSTGCWSSFSRQPWLIKCASMILSLRYRDWLYSY